MQQTNFKYVNITLRHMERDIRSWLDEKKNDPLTEGIVKATKESEMAKLTFKLHAGREMSDEEIEAHIRRGWSYMKAIFGYDKAVEVSRAAGTITTVASAIMLNHFESFADTELRKRHLEKLSYIPTLSTNIVEVLAEFNSCTGERIGTQLAQIVPMTDGERDAFRQSYEVIDHTDNTTRH